MLLEEQVLAGVARETKFGKHCNFGLGFGCSGDELFYVGTVVFAMGHADGRDAGGYFHESVCHFFFFGYLGYLGCNGQMRKMLPPKNSRRSDMGGICSTCMGRM